MPIPAENPVVVPETTYPYIWFDYLQIVAADPAGPAPVLVSTRPYRVDGSVASLCPVEIAPPTRWQFDLWQAMAQNPERAAARQRLFAEFLLELLLIKAELDAAAATNVTPPAEPPASEEPVA